MIITHKTFLKWLLYITIVLFSYGFLTYFNIPQIIYVNDHIYLSVLLFVIYLITEFLAGNQAIKLSSEILSLNNTIEWLRINKLANINKSLSDNLMLSDGISAFEITSTYLNDYLKNLLQKTTKKIDQTVLLSSLEDKLYFDCLISDFMASRIVWIGIFATIVGIVLAFFPFLGLTSFDSDSIRNHLPEFFRGIAVAFIPTALSFVFKIALDFNSRILIDGINDLFTGIKIISDVHIVPYLENNE